MKIHVEQTTDTDWEIRTGDNSEDRTVAGSVTVTGRRFRFRRLVLASRNRPTVVREGRRPEPDGWRLVLIASRTEPDGRPSSAKVGDRNRTVGAWC